MSYSIGGQCLNKGAAHFFSGKFPNYPMNTKAQTACNNDDRGRGAKHPGQIPAKGWRDIVYRIKDGLVNDNVSIIAAGVAFYALLAIFPALAALLSTYGLIANPADVQQQLNALSGILPAEARTLLNQQLSDIASRSGAALSVGVIVGLLITLWSASKGIMNLITALNIVYDEKEKRGFLELNGLALLSTAGAVVFAVLALGLIVALPALLGNLGLPEQIRTWVEWLRWPLLVLFVMIGLAVIYRYGPSRSKPRWRWVSWGAVVATLLWIVGSALFSFYVSHFGSYNETYGSVGAVVILMMWFYLSAYVVLLGAELNAEMEHQTCEDSTEGGSQPLGERGAYVADTVGKAADSG